METSSVDRLAVGLTLRTASKSHAIAAGNVQAFSVELHPWGAEGWVEFILPDNKAVGGKQKDALLADFIKPDLMEVSLQLTAVHVDSKLKLKPTPLTVHGLVAEKRLAELSPSGLKSAPVTERRYRVSFLDPARLLWRQHHPCALYTEKTFKDVLEAHKGEKIKLRYDWDAVLGVSHPLLFLGLVPEAGASFYDLVVWFTQRHRGVLTYDPAKSEYALSGAKAEKGEPLNLRADDMDSLEVVFPEVPRHGATVHNALAESPKSEVLTHKQAVAGIHQDVLLRTPIADEVNAQVQLKKAQLEPRGLELALRGSRMPVEAFTPGTLVKLPAGTGWNSTHVGASDTYRVRHLAVSGQNAQSESDVDRDATDAGFAIQLSTRLERKEEAAIELPAFTAPSYPHSVEGVLVSELGEEKDETWQAYSDPATSMDCYHVKIPLWEDQIVSAPFNPSLIPGQFYFPAYKGERVLVSLGFQGAWIKRFLDWRAGARLPQEAQGVQLLMGKTVKSGATLKHSYEEEKPVLLLQRLNESDTGTIRIQEGSMRIQVKEEKGS